MATLKKVAVTLVLADGNKSDGTVKTVNVGLGTTLNPDTYEDTKALAIKNAVADILQLEVYYTRKVETYNL